MSKKETALYEQVMARHKETLGDLEKMLDDLDVQSVTKRNEVLESQLDLLNENFKKLKTEYTVLQKECTEHKYALMEQIMSEKLTYIAGAKERIQLLFKEGQGKQGNSLEKIEKEMKSQISMCLDKTKSLSRELGERYQKELLEIQARLDVDYVNAQKQKALDYTQGDEQIQEAFNRDELKEINEQSIKSGVFRKGFEFKWGLNVMNKAGVLLILIAVVLAGHYTYNTFFNDYTRAISFYMIGASMLGVGEYFNRKKYGALAMSLIGGGIGVLYAATFISTFYLDILTLIPALGISVAIAGLSIVLASTYKSQMLGALSLVGGYLPVFAYVVVDGIATLPVLGAIAYLMILNGVILGLSLRHRWNIVVLIGFAFNLICVDTLVMLLHNTLLGSAIVFINFVTYLTIVLYRIVKRDEVATQLDMVVLSINTMGHVGMMYYMINRAGVSAINGVIAIGFGALYLMLGIWLKKKVNQAHLINMFLMTSGLFSVLVVPLQLDLEWWFFGWLLEAILFIAWGIKEQMRLAERGGWILLLVSHLTLFMSLKNFYSVQRVYPNLDDAKYLGIILASCLVVWLYRNIVGIVDGSKGQLVRLFRYFTLTHLMLFVFFEGVLLLNLLTNKISFVETTSILALVVYVTLNIAKRYNGHQWIQLSTYKLGAYAFVTLWILIANMDYQFTTSLRWSLEVVQMLILNYFAVMTINMALSHPALQRKLMPFVKTLVVSLYILFAYFLNFMIRVNTSFDQILINISLILFSIAYVVVGFKRRDGTLRQVGLGISFVATAKLLLLDSIALPLGQKIFCYLAFGLCLIGISYAYQRINSKWETAKVKEVHDVEKG